jgi:hypothetical protein
VLGREVGDGCTDGAPTDVVFAGQAGDGDLTGSDKESQEVSILALHPLQSELVHVALLLPDILSEEKWQKRLTGADRRTVLPLFWTHVNLYGRYSFTVSVPCEGLRLCAGRTGRSRR